MSPDERVRVCMTIAGSESGGGAGIQADLKAFARCGVHGTCAITAITAQNTVGVELVTQVPGPTVVAQVHAVAEDMPIDAVKVGMLGDEPTIERWSRHWPSWRRPGGRGPCDGVRERGDAAGPQRKGGADRAHPAARDGGHAQSPRGARAGRAGEGASAEELARAIHALGPEAVVVTGGHSDDGADVLFDGIGTLRIDGPRYADGTSHGSGCTHSSALAAFLARNAEVAEAARWAREIASEAVGNGLAGIGSGAGPVDATGIIRR